MTWDLWRSEWQISSMISIGFLIPVLFSKILIGPDRLSCLKVIFLGIWLIFLFGNDFPKIVIGFLISTLFSIILSGFPISITWMCKHDLGLVEVGMTDFFNDFDRFSDSSVLFQDFDILGIWLIFLFGSDFPKIVIGFLISIFFSIFC